MSIEERRLGSDLKLYNFNIVREAPYISREITRYRWEDGAKVSYQTLVWGKPDDLDNKFPNTAEDEGPGDPDANEPVPVGGGALIPSALTDKAMEAILAAKLQAQNVKAQAQGLLSSLGPAADSRELLTEEAFNLRALILEAKRVLAGGTQENFTPPTQADAKQYARRLQSNGSVTNVNIDRTKPYRDIKRTITERGETIENANVRLYGSQADLDQYFPLTLEV